jgi:hypothetical protein
MGRDWVYFDIRCKRCENEGSVGVQTGEDWNRWSSRWQRFVGQSSPLGPLDGTVRCTACTASDVVITKRVPGRLFEKTA